MIEDHLSRHNDLIEFRKQAKAKVDPEELTELSDSIFRQSNEFARDVAEVVFEDRCIEQFKLFLQSLKSAGYTKVVVMQSVSNSWGTISEIRAWPKMGARTPYAPLWTISSAYFPETTSRGGDVDSDMQGLAIKFPEELLGSHILCDDCGGYH